MSPDKDEGLRQLLLRQFRKIHDLRNIGQIVTAKCDCVGFPGADQRLVVFPGVCLQIDQPNIVPRLAARLSYHLEAERLQAQIDLGVHERTGMNCEELHEPKPPRL